MRKRLKLHAVDSFYKRFLIGGKNCNIYRLVHCDTKGNKNKWPLVYVIFSFLLQVCLTVFVVLEVFFITNSEKVTQTEELKYSLYILATLGSTYSLLVTLPEIASTIEAYSIFGQIGAIQMIDAIINVFIPLTLVVSGYFVIINETNFINGVLNTAALLFIPEIDDRIPSLLGYDENAVIENYLIKEAKIEYNEYLRLETADESIGKKFANAHGLGVEFNDYFITNSTEQGRSPQDFALYQPFIVKRNKEGHEIDPSNYITEDCLLRRVEWKFTARNTTKPRVGYLKLVKLTGEVIEINFSSGGEDITLGDLHCLDDGVYMITTFIMSSSILSLRLCGSKNAMDFVTAMEYYSLWAVTARAKTLLWNHKNDYTKRIKHHHSA